MKLWPFGKEQRNSPEDPRVPISDSSLMRFIGLDVGEIAGVTVNIDSALGVPAVWAAVNFLSGTMAGLPLNHYRKTETGRERQSGALASILHDSANDEMSSFEWRKRMFDTALTQGRGLSFIERNRANRVINFWPLDPAETTIRRKGGRKEYEYNDGTRKVTYQAHEVIDLPFMLKSNGLDHYSPIFSNKDTIALAIAATRYGAKFFENGGVPPFAIEGPFQSPAGIKRASDDLQAAVGQAAKEKRLALALPTGHTIKPIGADPEKSQLEQARRLLVEEIARVYSLPPVFLQDLTRGTFSNTEQQDLHLVKHTLRRWIEQFEQELNLKLFGRSNNRQYVEMNVDGLLRGDFKTRMEGYAQGIQNAIYTPNEVRRRENLPDDPQGELLLIQGATVPLGQQPTGESNDT